MTHFRVDGVVCLVDSMFLKVISSTPNPTPIT